MSQTNFDVASLRTFVAGMELGSFAKAADRVGRSTSAVSAQLKKLEEQAVQQAPLACVGLGRHRATPAVLRAHQTEAQHQSGHSDGADAGHQ